MCITKVLESLPVGVTEEDARQGSRRIKLGLRDLVSLGDFVQRIDDSERLAVRQPPFLYSH